MYSSGGRKVGREICVVIVIAYRHYRYCCSADIENILRNLQIYLPPFNTSPRCLIPVINLTLPSSHEPSISSAPVANILDPGVCVLRTVSSVVDASPLPETALKEGDKLRKGL
jgi:hypothetical protein